VGNINGDRSKGAINNSTTAVDGGVCLLGPFGSLSLDFSTNVHRHILLFAAGTGATSVFFAANRMVTCRQEFPYVESVHVIWAVRGEEVIDLFAESITSIVAATATATDSTTPTAIATPVPGRSGSRESREQTRAGARPAQAAAVTKVEVSMVIHNTSKQSQDHKEGGRGGGLSNDELRRACGDGRLRMTTGRPDFASIVADAEILWPSGSLAAYLCGPDLFTKPALDLLKRSNIPTHVETFGY